MRPLTILAAAAALSALLIGSAAAAPRFLSAPELRQNPNPQVPLAAVLRFEANEPVTTNVTLQDGDRRWTLSFPKERSPAAGLPLVGLPAGRELRVQVSIVDAKGEATTAPATISFTTAKPPLAGLEWPLIEADIRDAAAVEPGVTFISVRRRAPGRQSFQTPDQHRFARRWGLLLGLDERGEPVWWYQSNERIAGVQALPDGTILMTLQDQSVRVIDVLGNTIYEYVAEFSPEAGGARRGATPIKGVQTLHHEPYFTKRGTFVSMSANARLVKDYYTSMTDPTAPRRDRQVMGDDLLEFDKNGVVSWRWSVWDHFDPYYPHYHSLQPYWVVRGFPDHADWSHGNGVTFDERRGTIIASLKHLDALVGIAYPSGEVKWIYGDPANWAGSPLAAKVLRPVGEQVRFPASPHHPHINADGRITYYDNGMFQAKPFTGKAVVPQHLNFSRAAEIEIDERRMTVRETWTSDVRQTEDSCYNWAMGEAERTPLKGNVVATRAFCPPRLAALSDFDEGDTSKRFVDDVAYGGRIDQYARTSPAKLVSRFSLRDPNGVIQWQLYGTFFQSSLYWGPNAPRIVE